MPIVQPQVVRYDDLTGIDTSGLAGYGQLLRALVEQYRRRGPGQYIAQQDIGREGLPTVRAGETFPARAVPGRQAPPPGFAFQPARLPVFGPQYANPQQLQQMASVAALQKTQAELARQPLEMEEQQAKIESLRTNTALVKNLLKEGLLPVYDQTGNLVGARQTTPEAKPSMPAEGAQPTSPEELSLGQAVSLRTEQARRAAGRFVGTRQRQSALEKVFDSRAVTIQKNLGDAANISLPEQKTIRETFPKDGESDISRQEKFSVGVGLFDLLEQRTRAVLSEPDRMVLKGLSKTGPRFELDPARQALKRKAVEDLAKIQQGRLLLKQMFDEAAVKMPPIDTMSSEGLSPQRPDQTSLSGQPTLMHDAQGNQAYVYPDGRVEEVR